MTKRTVRRGTTRQGEGRGRNQILTTILVVLFLCAGGYYLWTGADPLHLFGGEEPEPAPIVAAGDPEDWWRVYFTVPRAGANPDDLSGSDLSGSVAEPLIHHIDAATQTIHVAAFEFDLPTVADALVAARGRGVQVHWITDDEYGLTADDEAGLDLFPALERAGVEVRDDGRSALMHHKFWIFDDRVLWTGSTNITFNGVLRNNNNVIVVDVPEIAAIYEREFSEMWNGAFGPTSPSTADAQTVLIGDSLVKALFAPEDEVIDHLVREIEGAHQSVWVMAYSFTSEKMADALLARARAGVDVRALFETRGSETDYSQLPPLYCAGVAARQDGNPRTFHHKVIVIDEETVVTGSLNFTTSADESNDENVLIVTNPDIAAPYLGEFARRWQEAVEPDPVDMNCR
jgi:phosphatidylserine/phosphatidylglycerophosphate/cardiolipin synthase-like enzyme